MILEIEVYKDVHEIFKIIAVTQPEGDFQATSTLWER